MWVPPESSIVPKTLLKWTLPQSNANKRIIVAIDDKKTKIKKKFKLIFKFKHSLILLPTTLATKLSLLPTPRSQSLSVSQSLLAIETKIIKNNNHLEEKRLRDTCTCICLCRLNCERRKAFVASLQLLIKHQSIFISIFFQSILVLITTVLMNDIRLKIPYNYNNKFNNNNNTKKILTKISLSTFTPKCKVAKVSSIRKNYLNSSGNNNNRNYRTYNNSSKSNKVFLYYTPRDPRLRIFNKLKFNQFPNSSRHLISAFALSGCLFSLLNNLALIRSDRSKLKIIHNLYNNCELIGGHLSNKSAAAAAAAAATATSSVPSPSLTVTIIYQLILSATLYHLLQSDEKENNNNNNNKRNNKQKLKKIYSDSDISSDQCAIVACDNFKKFSYDNKKMYILYIN